ncbi:MAG TPA: hypothetical protein DES72_09680 [Gammaproteobacteria bacterium]|jgi:hypothetical protein|nr:hypothetical protein [Gammaproteobacteria bacterium]
MAEIPVPKDLPGKSEHCVKQAALDGMIRSLVPLIEAVRWTTEMTHFSKKAGGMFVFYVSWHGNCFIN